VPVGAPRRYVVVHKPRGYVTSRRDPEGRPVVADLLPAELGSLFPVGRLDLDAEGLVLLTDDGALANRLLHPRYEVSRVYEVEVEGRVGAADLPTWRRGVTLLDGPAIPRAVRILDGAERSTRLLLTFAEGRNHEVKRYCQALGHPVRRLRRVAFGPLQLGRLRPGQWRELTVSEEKSLGGLWSRGGSLPPSEG